jgi:hypothetical protein
MAFKGADTCCGFEAVHARHLDIHQNQIKPGVLKMLDGCWPVGSMRDLVAERFKARSRHHGDCFRVIYQQNFHFVIRLLVCEFNGRHILVPIKRLSPKA